MVSEAPTRCNTPYPSPQSVPTCLALSPEYVQDLQARVYLHTLRMRWLIHEDACPCPEKYKVAYHFVIFSTPIA